MDYISAKEAAKVLEVSHGHMKKLLRDGEVKGIKLGRDWLVEAKSLKYKRQRKPKTKKESET